MTNWSLFILLAALVPQVFVSAREDHDVAVHGSQTEKLRLLRRWDQGRNIEKVATIAAAGFDEDEDATTSKHDNAVFFRESEVKITAKEPVPHDGSEGIPNTGARPMVELTTSTTDDTDTKTLCSSVAVQLDGSPLQQLEVSPKEKTLLHLIEYGNEHELQLLHLLSLESLPFVDGPANEFLCQ